MKASAAGRLLPGFILGSVFWAGVAVATSDVKVTFYLSSTPSVWCYLQSSGWVECIDDPCDQFRDEAARAKAAAADAKEEAERLRRQLRRLHP